MFIECYWITAQLTSIGWRLRKGFQHQATHSTPAIFLKIHNFFNIMKCFCSKFLTNVRMLFSLIVIIMEHQRMIYELTCACVILCAYVCISLLAMIFRCVVKCKTFTEKFVSLLLKMLQSGLSSVCSRRVAWSFWNAFLLLFSLFLQF